MKTSLKFILDKSGFVWYNKDTKKGVVVIRLWHYKLIPYLPRTQLLAQWRELNSIFVNQPNHILINYVYKDKVAFYNYSKRVIEEMDRRHYKISQKSWDNFCQYFINHTAYTDKHMFREHDWRYLEICYWNLYEKYLRGQKDFAEELWDGIQQVYEGVMDY